MLVFVCLITSTYVDGMAKVVSGSPGGHFAAWRLRKIEEFDRSVCTWKRQLCRLSDFLMLETCDVDI